MIQVNLICKRCGELWSMEALREEALHRYGMEPTTDRQQAELSSVYSQVVNDFDGVGCEAITMAGGLHADE